MERSTNDTSSTDLAQVQHDADEHTRVPGSGGGTAHAYRDRVPVSSNPTTNASASDAPSSDPHATLPPAGQRAPPSPSTPPRSLSALPSSSSTVQPTRLGLGAAAPTSSPDPLRILPTPSSAASASSRSGSRPRSRSRSQSAPVRPGANNKGLSRSGRGGLSSDDASAPSSAPVAARRQLGATSLTASAQDASSAAVGSVKQPKAHRTRLSAEIIVEESPAEDGELRRPSASASIGKDKGCPRESFDHVEVPLAKRRPPRTGANENDPDNETAAPPSRKTSVSRTSSAPPAAAASPVLTQSQTAGSPVPDRKEPGLPVAQMDLDPSSARTSSASSRQYPFAVVVPPKASNSSTFRRQSQVSDLPATPSDKPSAVPGPANDESSELSSPPNISPALTRTTLAKRSRSPQSSPGHSAGSPQPGPSQSPVKRRKEAALGTSTAGPDLDGDDGGPAQLPVLAGKRPRRAAAKPGMLKESSSEAGSDDDGGRGNNSESSVVPKKRPKTKRAPVVRPAVRKRVVSESRKGKESKANLPLSPAPLSTQTRSDQLLELAKLQPAPRETPEQRQEKWVLNRMDVVVWTLVEHDSTRFWWPANIQSKPRSARPLKLSFIADSSEEISVINPAREVAIDDPAPTNILSFRSAPRAIVRFDRANYVEEAGAGAAPSPDAFERALAAALLAQDAELDGDDDSDSNSDSEVAPAVPAASKGKGAARPAPRAAKKAKAKAKVVTVDSNSDGEPAAVESDDELTKGSTEIESITTFPFRCVARNKGRWWGALCVSYVKPVASQPSGKSQAAGVYNIQWTDGTVGRVKRTDLALPSEAKFFQVKLGETELAVDDDYASDLVRFVQHEGAVWQSIIDDQFAPAAVWNSDFYAGGSRRRDLSKKARYGELLEEHRDAVTEALRAWALPKTGARPTGSAQYEALSDTSRSIYVADVLLSIAVVLVIVEERSFGELARQVLKIPEAEHDSDENQCAIMDEAFKLAQEELEKGSLAKWVVSVRSARAQATANRKQR